MFTNTLVLFTLYFLAIKISLIPPNLSLELNQNQQLVSRVQPRPVYNTYISSLDEYRPSGLYLNNFKRSSVVSQRQLPQVGKLNKFLNQICDTAVLQLERGSVRGKKHYQRAFVLMGPRISKKNLLVLFGKKFSNVGGLTLSKVYRLEAVMEYSSKEETRIGGPFYSGKKELFEDNFSSAALRSWQEDFFDFLLVSKDEPIMRERKIIWIEDANGNSGKSFFLKYLRVGQRQLIARKLPVTSVDRLISGVRALAQQTRFDLLMVNLTRTLGKDQHLSDLFAILEEVKNGFLIDSMYGKYNESVFEPPLLFVFTNLCYKDYLSKLSEDRWLPLFINSD